MLVEMIVHSNVILYSINIIIKHKILKKISFSIEVVAFALPDTCNHKYGERYVTDHISAKLGEGDTST
jgi:hypothetical protein